MRRDADGWDRKANGEQRLPPHAVLLSAGDVQWGSYPACLTHPVSPSLSHLTCPIPSLSHSVLPSLPHPVLCRLQSHKNAVASAPQVLYFYP